MKSSSIKAPVMSRSRLRQDDTEPWPKGLSLAVAVLASEPEDLRKERGIEFTDSHDGLDYTKSAILQLRSRAQVALVRHRDCPSPGTEVWIHENSPAPSQLLDELLTALKLDRDTVTWTLLTPTAE